MTTLTQGIFKAYDIRGIIDKTLDAGIARDIGRAFGSAARAKGEKTVVIGRDGRLSGPELAQALAEGLADFRRGDEVAAPAERVARSAVIGRHRAGHEAVEALGRGHGAGATR